MIFFWRSWRGRSARGGGTTWWRFWWFGWKFSENCKGTYLNFLHFSIDLIDNELANISFATLFAFKQISCMNNVGFLVAQSIQRTMMTIMSRNTVQSGKRERNEKPNQIRIARRKSERRMVAERIQISLRQLKKMSATLIMHRQKKAAARRRKRSNRPRHQAAERLIQVCFNSLSSFFHFACIH